MDKPEEIEFTKLLYGGVIAMIVLALILILLAVLYQRRLFAQQTQLHQLELNRQQDILKSVVQSQERERERIARDLHDEVGASLSTAKLFVSQILYETSTNDMKNLAQQAGGILGEMVRDVRQIAHNLSPIILEDVGLVEAIRLMLNRLQATGLYVESQIDNLPDLLDNEKQLALYRITQEVLNNVLKHANASRLSLTLIGQNDTLLLKIEDNGQGFAYSDDSNSVGVSMGMGSIKARASMLKAHLNIVSSKGLGTCIELTIPI